MSECVCVFVCVCVCVCFKLNCNSFQSSVQILQTLSDWKIQISARPEVMLCENVQQNMIKANSTSSSVSSDPEMSKISTSRWKHSHFYNGLAFVTLKSSQCTLQVITPNFGLRNNKLEAWLMQSHSMSFTVSFIMLFIDKKAFIITDCHSLHLCVYSQYLKKVINPFKTVQNYIINNINRQQAIPTTRTKLVTKQLC